MTICRRVIFVSQPGAELLFAGTKVAAFGCYISSFEECSTISSVF